jgi:predicted ATPase
MRLVSLSVTNFRAITHLDLNALEDTVIIAGPNGSGKSCIFDAIKMLKSAYGGYQPNEWQTWMSEFQIDLNRKGSALSVLLQDKSAPLLVRAVVGVTDGERSYLQSNAEELLRARAWEAVAPNQGRRVSLSVAASERVHNPVVEARVAEELPALLSELQQQTFVGEVRIDPAGAPSASVSLVLELIFGTYDSKNIGILDYHGANRNYAREQIAAVNLNIQSSEDKLRQHALYNYANKYNNLKTELASSYVRNLLAKEANSGASSADRLNETMKELFETFFPGKTFLGPVPMQDGGLSFPVRTAAGAEHDIDELSSGEKEVLYGYLRIRNAAPRHSVLLIDEPELHLNPRLIKGLASFYHRHLGKALDNQLWLVTHSDTLIREAVGQRNFVTFHMQSAGEYCGISQATRVTAGQALERVVIDLVGDLAAYRPNAKIVLFEGGGDQTFDVKMTSSLFPRFDAAVNAISAGSKARVAQLHELLERARQDGHLPARFYSVTDADGEFVKSLPANTFQWDVYHIENYLLSPIHIFRVLQEISLGAPQVDTEQGVLDLLTQAASLTIPSLVSHELTAHADKLLVDCLDLRFDPKRSDVGAALSEAVDRAKTKISATPLTKGTLTSLQEEITQRAENELKSGRWMTTFRGRDVLRRFCDIAKLGIAYEVFRGLIIARMREAKYEPPGMRDVIDRILSAT